KEYSVVYFYAFARLMTTLPIDHLEPLMGWGGAVGSAAYVFRPSTVAQFQAVFTASRGSGPSITLRGAGWGIGVEPLRHGRTITARLIANYSMRLLEVLDCSDALLALH